MPAEVLRRIVEEACITAELDNLGQTVTVELCPPGDSAGEGEERHPSSSVQGVAQVVRYNGGRPDIRQQRDQLDALIVQRFREQSVGRVVSASFIHGAHTSHELGRFDQSTQAKLNRLILNHRPDIRSLLALASTCRLLRAHAEPFLYRYADLDYGNPCAYAEHLELLLRYPHLRKYVRLLSFGNLYDEKFEDDWYGFLPLNPIRLSQAVDRLLAQDAPVSRDELYRQLGPDRFGPHGLHPSIFRAMFLFLLPDVRSLKIDLALTEDASQAEQTRREWLFRTLLGEPNDVWAAGKIPALQNLEEFSLVPRGSVAVNAINPRLLLPFLFLPKMRTFYTSSLATVPHLNLHRLYDKPEYFGKSPVTEMIFDFTAIDGFTLDSLLALPRALEKLTVNFVSVHPSDWDVLISPDEDPDEDSDEEKMNERGFSVFAVGDALQQQRHSLKKLTLRWANVHRGCSIFLLSEFTVLEELTAPMVMVLYRRHGVRRSLRETLPASIVRLELLAYRTVPVPDWQPEVLGLLNRRDVHVPKLRWLRIEQWLEPGCRVSKYDLEAEAVVNLGRLVGVEVRVDFKEHPCPERISSDVDEDAEDDTEED